MVNRLSKEKDVTVRAILTNDLWKVQCKNSNRAQALLQKVHGEKTEMRICLFIMEKNNGHFKIHKSIKTVQTSLLIKVI